MVDLEATIMCGEHDRFDGRDPDKLELKVSEIISYPGYQSADKGLDVAIFKVTKPSDMNTEDKAKFDRLKSEGKIGPACLPRIDQEYGSGDFIVAGWGKTQYPRRFVRNVRQNMFAIVSLFDFNRMIDWPLSGSYHSTLKMQQFHVRYAKTKTTSPFPKV